MPTATVTCPNCKSEKVSAADTRARCENCGAHFNTPPPQPGPCPSCGSTATIRLNNRAHCNQCSLEF